MNPRRTRRLRRKRLQVSTLNSYLRVRYFGFSLIRSLSSKRYVPLLLLVSSIIICIVYLKGYKPGKKSGKSTWDISTSKVDITPTEPVWLSGFASRNRTAESNQPLDPAFPLYARAIALRNKTAESISLPLVLVSLDVIGFDRHFSATVYEEVEREFGISRDRLRICATHTHSGPVVGRNLILLMPNDHLEHQKVTRYTESLISAVLRAIRECIDGLHTTVELYHSEVLIPLATNRRQVLEREFSGFRGTTEDKVPVLWFRKGNRVVGGMFGVAAHATILTSGYKYSGDYPGFAAKELEHQVGGVWLFLAGCGGDQNIYPRGTADLMKRHGSKLVDGILQTVKGGGRILESDAVAGDTYVDVQFSKRYNMRELSIRARSRNAIERRAAEQLLAKGIGKDGKTDSSYPFPLGAWRLGDVSIVFMGGEPTVGYDRLLKKAGASWVVGYCQDVMGYIGTAEVIREGGREGGERAAWYYGLPSAWAVDTERRIMDSAHSVLMNLTL